MILSNEVECDEAYVIAGHKGQPEVIKSKERKGRRRRLKGKSGRGTLETQVQGGVAVRRETRVGDRPALKRDLLEMRRARAGSSRIGEAA